MDRALHFLMVIAVIIEVCLILSIGPHLYSGVITRIKQPPTIPLLMGGSSLETSGDGQM